MRRTFYRPFHYTFVKRSNEHSIERSIERPYLSIEHSIEHSIDAPFELLVLLGGRGAQGGVGRNVGSEEVSARQDDDPLLHQGQA